MASSVPRIRHQHAPCPALHTNVFLDSPTRAPSLPRPERTTRSRAAMDEPLDVGLNHEAFTSDIHKWVVIKEEQQDWVSSQDPEDPEPPHIKEDQEDLELPHIKEDQEDLEPPHIKEDQEDPEPPHIKEDQEDPEPPHIKEDPEEAGITFPFAPVNSEDEEDYAETEPEMWESSEEDDGGSEPEGFESSDEEEYQNNQDPFEDGEDSPASSSPPSKRSRPLHPRPSPMSWKTDKDPDTAPPVIMFQPARTPGPRLDCPATRTPLGLFKLFFPEDAVRTLCQNTNKQAAKQIANGKKFRWGDVDVECFYKYIGLLLYTTFVKLDRFANYWRQNHLLSLPSQIMARERYMTISWNLHLSDPDGDVHNDGKAGTDEHDKLFQVKPLMDTIKSACRAFYHPHRDLAVAERIVASTAKRATTPYMKGSSWDFKLFALADSRNGYTVDFSIRAGKSHAQSKHGLSHDVVMSLVRPGYLGTGYHIYMGAFHSNPKLFLALHECGLAACGTYSDSREGFPRPDDNALTKESPSGAMRWIRDGPVVYVKWMDAKKVSVCSTIHAAHSGDTVERRVKQPDGSWATASVPGCRAQGARGRS